MLQIVRAGLILLFLAATSAAEQPARLWTPEGYQLLSADQLRDLPKNQVEEVGRRNTALIRTAIRTMTPAECQAVAESLDAYAREHARDLSDAERQYIVRTQMMLLSAGSEEQAGKLKQARESRLKKEAQEEDSLARDQEEAGRGFPPDLESVEKEASAVEELIGKEDASKLYLRILGPLRSRPWNERVRVVFRKIIRGRPALINAALRFIQARRADTPEEGAWDSLEAFIRLSMRDQVADSKKLFAIAISKNSRDVESLIFPLLLAEIEEDSEQIARLLPRAQKAWPRQEDLGRVFFDSITLLPYPLQAKAIQSFEARYSKEHPTDWATRLQLLWNKLQIEPDNEEESHVRQVEQEASSLLALPVAFLPEPHRAEVFTIQLVAQARRGRCDEVEPQLGWLDSELAAAYPRQFETGLPPSPRSTEEVRALRASLAESQSLEVKLEAYLRTGSTAGLEGFEDVPPAERQSEAKTLIAELKQRNAETVELLGDKGDATAAAAWSQRQLANWEKEHGLEGRYYDIPSRAEKLSILVRLATGKCLIAKGRFDRVTGVLKPCFGRDRNLHFECIGLLVEAGVTLARAKRITEAALIYRTFPQEVVGSGSIAKLFQAIEEVAPGTLDAGVANVAPSNP